MPRAAPQENPELSDKKQPADIVVTADRYGDASIAAETEFDENEIAAQGADNIADLLSRLQPFIDPDGNNPVLLINGKPAGFDRSILSYPAEALTRLAVLKPEAGARYGTTSGERVVNLVLKKKFSSLNADAGVNVATAGGQFGGNLAITRTAISGDTRWNAQARIERESALFKSARHIPPPPGVFDSVGYITGLDGGEIDPALSLAAGGIVTVAAIPAVGASDPSLSDFVATANQRHPIDPNTFEMLQPSVRNVALNIGVTRPLSSFSVSLTLDASRNDSDGLVGVQMVSLVLPAGSRWSPFGGAVILNRPFDGTRALRNSYSAQSLAASLTLNGTFAGVQSNLAAGFSHSDSRNLLETGANSAQLQQLIDGNDPMFNPYGRFGDSLLQASRNRSRADTLTARINLQKTVVDLPAGPLAWGFSANGGRASYAATQSDQAGIVPTSDHSSTQLSGQMSLNLPISRRGAAFAALGNLSIDLSVGRLSMTGSSAQTSLGGGVTWAPFAPIQLRGSIERTETAPSFDQLDGPIVTAITRVFDYARQEYAEPTWITGGNSQLGRGRQESIALSMMVRPLGRVVTLNVGYRQSVASGGPTGFPELTPPVEAAFPERVTRDGAGHLVAVDARPINIEREENADLNSSLALRLDGTKRRGSEGPRVGAAGDPIQFNLSLNHRFRLRSEMLIRRGLPVIDRLNGESGASRHMLNLQLGIGNRAFGAGLGASWSSPTRVTGSDGEFRFRPPLTCNFSSFINPHQLFTRLKGNALTAGLKISFNIQNLFNGYRRVTLADGSAPVGYTHDEVDPLGRTLRLTLGKRF